MKERGAAVMVEEDERLKEGEELPCFLLGFQVPRYEGEEEEQEIGGGGSGLNEKREKEENGEIRGWSCAPRVTGVGVFLNFYFILLFGSGLNPVDSIPLFSAFLYLFLAFFLNYSIPAK